MFKWRSTRVLVTTLREEQARLVEELRQEILGAHEAARAESLAIAEQIHRVRDLVAGIDGLRLEVATNREENLSIARKLDQVRDLVAGIDGLRLEVATNREENLSIARKLDQVRDLVAGIDGLRLEVVANREENQAISRQLDEVREFAAGIDGLRFEVAAHREENLTIAQQFDYVRDLAISLGGVRQEIAATREEHIVLAKSLDGIQIDLERLAIAMEDVCNAQGHELLELTVGAARQSLRLAVIGTPRSGNTWLRLMLGQYYNLQERAVDFPSEIGELPSRAIVQIHWPPESEFVHLLAAQGIKPIIIARHPLDVLLSLLHFIRHEPRTARWLGGKAEIPVDLIGKTPVSIEFRDYCLSEGAASLLAVTPEWWSVSNAVRCRYEDLVQDTTATLRRVRNSIGIRGVVPLAKVAASVRFDEMRSLANKHGWRGSPGHWRKLVPPKLAAEIYERHRNVFEVLGYEVGDYQLAECDALAHWQSIATEGSA